MTNPAFLAELSQLFQLQQIDLKLHSLQKQLALFPQQHTEKKQVFDAFAAIVAQHQALLAETKRLKEFRESQLETLQASLKEKEQKMLQISSFKGYEAMEKEIFEAKQAINTVEEQLLEQMENLEQISEKTTQLQTQFHDKESEFSQFEATLADQQAVCEQEQRALLESRNKVFPSISQELYQQYEFIRKRYPEALCAVSKGVCGGCRLSLPPQVKLQLAKAEKFLHCPSCQRLIYDTLHVAEK